MSLNIDTNPVLKQVVSFQDPLCGEGFCVVFLSAELLLCPRGFEEENGVFIFSQGQRIYPRTLRSRLAQLYFITELIGCRLF